MRYVLLICLAGLSLQAQFTGYQKLYNRSNHLFTDLYQHGYETYLANVGHNDYSSLELTYLDHLGQQIASYDFSPATFNSNFVNFHFMPCDNCLQVKGEKLFYAFSIFDQASNSAFAQYPLILSVLNKDLSDTVRQKRITIPGLRTFTPGSMRFDTDSTFILAGQGFDRFNGYHHYIAKFEDNLNCIWDTTIAQQAYYAYQGPSAILIDPYGYALITAGGIVNQNNASYMLRISLDSGRVDWEIKTDSTDNVGDIYCAMRPDSHYQIIREIQTPTHAVLMEAAVMDTNGQIVNSKRFRIPDRLVELHGLTSSLDGNFYAVGTFYYGNWQAFGFKFNPQLDSLWLRPYWYDDSIRAKVRIQDVAQRPDSLFIHVGNIVSRPYFGDSSLYVFTTNQEGWNKHNQSINSSLALPTENWSFYPNPSSGLLHLKTNYRGALRLCVFNLQGQKVLEQHRPLGLRRSFKTKLEPGVYWFMVFDAKEDLRTKEKIVIY